MLLPEQAEAWTLGPFQFPTDWKFSWSIYCPLQKWFLIELVEFCSRYGFHPSDAMGPFLAWRLFSLSSITCKPSTGLECFSGYLSQLKSCVGNKSAFQIWDPILWFCSGTWIRDGHRTTYAGQGPAICLFPVMRQKMWTAKQTKV